jgi:hypothetical protein
MPRKQADLATAITSLGTAQLHKRHSVMIEGGQVPRARVMDQTVMDRYLMQGALTITQHQAGEHLLEQAMWAGMWARGMRWDGAGSHSAGCVVPLGVGPFGDALASIRKTFSPDHAWLVRKLVIDNCDIAEDLSHMDKVRTALDFLSGYGVRRNYSPITRLKKRA